MKRKRGILLVAAAVTILSVMAMLLLSSREPVYNGKTLTVWMEQSTKYGGFGTGDRRLDEVNAAEARNAIHEIGTNAIPTLLRYLRKQDSPLKLKLIASAQKQNIIKIHFMPATERNYQAFDAFRILRGEVKDAVPALMQIWSETGKSQMEQKCLLYSLGCIGPAASNAIPMLLRELNNTNYETRNDAMVALAEIHAKSEIVVPALIRCLPDPQSRETVVRALGEFGVDAKSAVPTLVELLNDPNGAVVDATHDALKHIDPETAAKAGLK